MNCNGNFMTNHGFLFDWQAMHDTESKSCSAQEGLSVCCHQISDQSKLCKRGKYFKKQKGKDSQVLRSIAVGKIKIFWYLMKHYTLIGLFTSFRGRKVLLLLLTYSMYSSCISFVELWFFGFIVAPGIVGIFLFL